MKEMFHSITAARVPVTLSRCIDQRDMHAVSAATVAQRFDGITNAMRFDLQTSIVAMPKERITVNRSWPKTWWDAVKDRWYPEWAKTRWPVEYERINIDQQIYGGVCPHLQSDPTRTHVTYLAGTVDNAIPPLPKKRRA